MRIINGNSRLDEELNIPERLKGAAPGYLMRRLDDIKSLNDYIDKGDYVSIRSISHKIKGSGAGYGFKAISHFGGEMERQALAEENLEKIREICDEFEKTVCEYLVALTPQN